MSVACPEHVAPEDVAAWAVDGERHERVDLAAHVPGCAACSAVVAAVAPSSAAATALRAERPPTPAAVSDRAAGRIRIEATTSLLLQTLGGALERVARAAPDYLRSRTDRETGRHRS